jgi:hypothetical protein
MRASVLLLTCFRPCLPRSSAWNFAWPISGWHVTPQTRTHSNWMEIAPSHYRLECNLPLSCIRTSPQHMRHRYPWTRALERPRRWRYDKSMAAVVYLNSLLIMPTPYSPAILSSLLIPAIHPHTNPHPHAHPLLPHPHPYSHNPFPMV